MKRKREIPFWSFLSWAVLIHASCLEYLQASLVLGLQGSASWRLLPDLVSFYAWEPCSIWTQHTLGMHRATLDLGYSLHCLYRIHSLHKFPSQSLHMNPSLVFTSAQVLCFCQAKSGRNHRLVNYNYPQPASGGSLLWQDPIRPSRQSTGSALDTWQSLKLQAQWRKEEIKKKSHQKTFLEGKTT